MPLECVIGTLSVRQDGMGERERRREEKNGRKKGEKKGNRQTMNIAAAITSTNTKLSSAVLELNWLTELN